MLAYRCKCGATTSYGSMSPDRCAGCSECGTALSLNGADRSPEQHQMVECRVETDSGDAVLTRCRWCHKTKREVESEARAAQDLTETQPGRPVGSK